MEEVVGWGREMRGKGGGHSKEFIDSQSISFKGGEGKEDEPSYRTDHVDR